MQRQVCWFDRLEDGIKREVRVTVQQGKVKWQFKRATDERWDYDSLPSKDDWNTLLAKLEDRYNRRSVAFDDLELARKLFRQAIPGG